MRNITQDEWRDLLANDTSSVIIDTRTLQEWQDGVFENAVLIDVFNPQSFMDKVEKIKKEKNIMCIVEVEYEAYKPVKL